MRNARPRLVKEGIPITGIDNSDDTMTDAAAVLDQNLAEDETRMKRSEKPVQSSLARAASSSSGPSMFNRKSRPQARRFVIGKEKDDDMDCSESNSLEGHGDIERYASSHRTSTSQNSYFEIHSGVGREYQTPLHSAAVDPPRAASWSSGSAGIQGSAPHLHNSFPTQAAFPIASLQHHLQTPVHVAPPNQSFNPQGNFGQQYLHSNNNGHSFEPMTAQPINPPPPTRPKKQYTSTSYHHEIGADYRQLERMEGVEDHSTKPPLVVLDGANVAYSYADAIAGLEGAAYHETSTKREPDCRGIQVATNYFAKAGLRVLVVLPAPWFRAKPRPGDRGNAKMLTPQMEILEDLKAGGLLVSSPPLDDDDAYALTIARREDSRARKRQGQGPGFVLSNDMFRDAMDRDASGQLRDWLNKGNNAETGPGRISYAFCDMGSLDDHGDRELDFVPNPRHPLISWIETLHHQS